jgi:hypothetical protein
MQSLLDNFNSFIHGPGSSRRSHSRLSGTAYSSAHICAELAW